MTLPNQIFPVERSITQFKGLSVEQAIIIMAEQIAMIHFKQNEIIQQVNEHSALLKKKQGINRKRITRNDARPKILARP